MFLVLLGAFVALGISMSAIASSGMAIGTIEPLAMMGDMASTDCQGSGIGAPCEMDAPSCALVCAAPVLSLPSAAASPLHAIPARVFVAFDAGKLAGTSPPPDLSPPRTTHIV